MILVPVLSDVAAKSAWNPRGSHTSICHIIIISLSPPLSLASSVPPLSHSSLPLNVGRPVGRRERRRAALRQWRVAAAGTAMGEKGGVGVSDDMGEGEGVAALVRSRTETPSAAQWSSAMTEDGPGEAVARRERCGHVAAVRVHRGRVLGSGARGRRARTRRRLVTLPPHRRAPNVLSRLAAAAATSSPDAASPRAGSPLPPRSRRIAGCWISSPSSQPPPRRPLPCAGSPHPPRSRRRSKVTGEKEEEGLGGERDMVMMWYIDMWDPHGSHADSTAISDKTWVKTTEGPKLNDFVSWEMPYIWFYG